MSAPRYERRDVEVLIPTCDRPAALAVTLTALAAQDELPSRIVVADQGRRPASESGEVQAVAGVLRLRGVAVEIRHRPARRGLAEQRQFLLDQASAPAALFLDDDVILEPDLLGRLRRALDRAGCGFVGCGLIGPSYADDERPHEQAVELWEGPVEPELVEPGGPAWDRHRLHNAANLLHVARRLGLGPGDERLYRVAWIGGCVLYDVEALRAVGGFGFWRDLPPHHSGEDVLAQLRVMARFGGAGLLPSGAYHQELPTTVPHRDVDAPHVLPVLVDGVDDRRSARPRDAGVR